ncbi:hypothetical protein VNO77_19376 [Canavalia gladiata]|uniref:Uncharacterized protein n=1 Tax=Canavalia gladiata TaxID=3824 RepID=A0AAN9LMM8_CANGL
MLVWSLNRGPSNRTGSRRHWLLLIVHPASVIRAGQHSLRLGRRRARSGSLRPIYNPELLASGPAYVVVGGLRRVGSSSLGSSYELAKIMMALKQTNYHLTPGPRDSLALRALASYSLVVQIRCQSIHELAGRPTIGINFTCSDGNLGGFAAIEATTRHDGYNVH